MKRQVYWALNDEQRQVLDWIRKNPGAYVADLMRGLGLKKSSAFNHVSRLTLRGKLSRGSEHVRHRGRALFVRE